MNWVNSDLLFLPVGGSEEIGMNANLYHYEDKWILVDLGISFPDETDLGVDVLLPDFDFIQSLGDKFSLNKMDKLFQVILKSATYEFLYKPNLSINIIIKEYLNASNFFLDDSQTKYLNALLDNVGKKLRSTDA